MCYYVAVRGSSKRMYVNSCSSLLTSTSSLSNSKFYALCGSHGSARRSQTDTILVVSGPGINICARLLEEGSSFVSLLREIASIPARTTLSRKHKSSVSSSHSPRTVVNKWIAALRKNYSPLPRGTTASVLRLLFPEDDTQRKFGLQETLLAQYLGQCLDSSTVFTSGSAKRLKVWNQESASGCLGQELLRYVVPGTEVLSEELSVAVAILTH